MAGQAACRAPRRPAASVTRAGADLGGTSQRVSPTFRSLRSRSYRLYASGQLLANTGVWMQRVAQDWLVLELTDGSATALGIAVGLQFLPLLLFSMWGGGLADRFLRRNVLLVTSILLGLSAL